MLHGVVEDHSDAQGYMIRIEERQESRWMALPDPDVDFAQRVSSGAAVATSQPKSPRVRGMPRGYHCQKVVSSILCIRVCVSGRGSG